MPFLSETLQSGPIDFIYLSHSPYQSFSKKAGGTYMAGELTIKTRSTGAISKEKIFNEAFYQGFTKRLTPGCLIRAQLSPKNPKNIDWEILPTGDAGLDVPQMSNGKQVKIEREYSHSNDEQAEKSIAISLQGLVQAYVSRGGELTGEALLREALSFAANARDAINKKAHEIHAGPSLKEELDAFAPPPESPVIDEPYNF
jgi:hypothetical protein